MITTGKSVSQISSQAYLVDRRDKGSVGRANISFAEAMKGRQIMTNQSNFSFTVSPEAAASFHDDGIVILHAGQGRLFSSNGTGARIWQGVEQHLPLETIADEISGEYQTPRTTVHEHMVAFLAELERNQLIKREAVS